MNYFEFKKHQLLDDNVLFVSEKVYGLLTDEKHIDVILEKYCELRDIKLNPNLEKTIFRSLSFLYSIELIEMKGAYIRRCKR